LFYTICHPDFQLVIITRVLQERLSFQMSPTLSDKCIATIIAG
jgi:hypothetical protein